MATTINGVSRYASDGSANTAFAGMDSRFGGLVSVQVDFPSLTGAGAVYSVLAPCGGTVKAAYLQSQTTTDGTNKITVIVQNESNSSADIVASQLYDDDPVVTSNTATALTVVAANAAVDRGDNIEVSWTAAGTIAGGAVILFIEPNAD